MTSISYSQPAELRGARVSLVPFEEAYLEPLRRWRADSEVTRYWITQAVPTPEEMRAWLAANRQAGTLMWLIRSETGEPIGYADLFNLDRENRKAEVSLMIGERAAWGRGYARDALRTLLRHAFAPAEAGGVGLHKVSLSVFAENAAARRVYAACGFREDGVLRDDMWRAGAWHDQILMSLLESEFAASEEGVR